MCQNGMKNENSFSVDETCCLKSFYFLIQELQVLQKLLQDLKNRSACNKAWKIFPSSFFIYSKARRGSTLFLIKSNNGCLSIVWERTRLMTVPLCSIRGNFFFFKSNTYTEHLLLCLLGATSNACIGLYVKR